MQVDGIANSIRRDFCLSRGVISRIILERAGSAIQADLNSQRPQELPQFGSVVVTKGYNMAVQFIFHGMLRSFLDGEEESQKVDPLT
jgi:O-acetyl-ADP-ribose deacetylase (regulator of RNase III)